MSRKSSRPTLHDPLRPRSSSRPGSMALPGEPAARVAIPGAQAKQAHHDKPKHATTASHLKDAFASGDAAGPDGASVASAAHSVFARCLYSFLLRSFSS